MKLQLVDWLIVAAYLGISLLIGLVGMRRAGSSAKEFFLAGRSMPWWLLGISMVATTFSTDTPNLVTDIVRRHGVAGNWVWWAFLLTGMLTTFVYARLWSRSGVLTDVEFYELRYSGRLAPFLRGFRAVYLGGFFNVMIMASVTLAAIKIGGVLLGVGPTTSVVVACAVTVVYAMIGGLTGVLLTDFFQFVVAMAGSFAAARYALARPEVGGLQRLLEHPDVAGRLDLVPDFSDPGFAVAIFVVPLAVQWWSVWYPGSEPGGGGYIAQRMLAAKSEGHAQGATFLFNACHYALRPWPWIVVALASLVVFPDLESLRTAFPNVDPRVIGHDLAYPAMLTFLPAGILGVVVASLAAAFMSTISTHLNWGSSYLVNDLYRRFMAPDASERRLVLVGRLCTVVLMFAAGAVSLLLSNALQAFQILLQIGAGTGLLFLLRWFWRRINAACELVAMVASFAVAAFFQLVETDLLEWQQLVAGVGITTVAWMITAFVTRPTDEATLRRFFERTRPAAPALRAGVACMVLGSVAIYAALFATGLWLYGRSLAAAGLTGVGVAAALGVLKLWPRLAPAPAAP